MSSIIVTFKVDIGKKTPDQNTVGEGLCLIVFNPSRALEQINLIFKVHYNQLCPCPKDMGRGKGD